jgi:hypothetical protein
MISEICSEMFRSDLQARLIEFNSAYLSKNIEALTRLAD